VIPTLNSYKQLRSVWYRPWTLNSSCVQCDTDPELLSAVAFSVIPTLNFYQQLRSVSLNLYQQLRSVWYRPWTFISSCVQYDTDLELFYQKLQICILLLVHSLAGKTKCFHCRHGHPARNKISFNSFTHALDSSKDFNFRGLHHVASVTMT
jgi:hypothetical protein